jgi:hypothetical protein
LIVKRKIRDKRYIFCTETNTVILPYFKVLERKQISTVKISDLNDCSIIGLPLNLLIARAKKNFNILVTNGENYVGYSDYLGNLRFKDYHPATELIVFILENYKKIENYYKKNQ